MSFEERSALIQSKHGEAISRALTHELSAIMDTDANSRRKAIRIHQLADKIMGMIGQHTVCRKGCAHCCHIANAISQVDAERIAAHTGRKAAALGWRQPSKDDQRSAVRRFKGVPCPFLGVRNECTVYMVRPLSCRVHHSLNDTPDPCYPMEGAPGSVPQVNLQVLQTAEVHALRGETFRDIREWFPPASSSSS